MQSSEIQPNVHINKGLAEQAVLLRTSPYFTVEGSSSLAEKQLVFYVLAGLKPASEVGSYHTEWLSATHGESRGDDLLGLTALLDRLGLRYSFRSPYDGTAVVARDEAAIAEHRKLDRLTSNLQRRAEVEPSNSSVRDAQAAIYRAAGQLYGYPETAVEAAVSEWAYNRSALLPDQEQHRVEDASGLPGEAFLFRFSGAHWQDELATVRRWYALVRAFGMETPADGRGIAGEAA